MQKHPINCPRFDFYVKERQWGLEPDDIGVLTVNPCAIVQDSALKESGHECQTIGFDVGTSSKGVEDRIGTTTDKSQSRGDRTAEVQEILQSEDRQRMWLQSGSDGFWRNICGPYFTYCSLSDSFVVRAATTWPEHKWKFSSIFYEDLGKDYQRQIEIKTTYLHYVNAVVRKPKNAERHNNGLN